MSSNSILAWGGESLGIPHSLMVVTFVGFTWNGECRGIPHSLEAMEAKECHTHLKWQKSRNSTLTCGGESCGIPCSPKVVKIEESHAHFRWWKSWTSLLTWGDKVEECHTYVGDESRGIPHSNEVAKAVDFLGRLGWWKPWISTLNWEGERPPHSRETANGFYTHLRWWMSRASIHTWGSESRGLLYSFEGVKVVDFVLTWGAERHLYSFEMLKVKDFHTRLRWWKTSELIWDT